MNPLASGIRWVLKGNSGTAATLQTLLARYDYSYQHSNRIITARTLGPEGRGEQAAMILWPQFLAGAMTLAYLAL
jgi:hypothetical protein